MQKMENSAPLRAESLIRSIPDFPQKGVLFRDITPVLADADAFREVVDRLVALARQLRPDRILGIESRGFLMGAPIALELGLGFALARKEGKLPADKIREEYALEYGTNVLELHSDAVRPGERVVVVDDLLATGGTAAAAGRMVQRLGGTPAGFLFFIELEFLKGRSRLEGYPVHSLVRF